LKERITTIPVSAPAAAECTDIFHQKLIIATTITSNVEARVNDLIKNGSWNRNTIKEVMQYKNDTIIRGVILSCLSSILYELIIFLYLR